MTQASLGLFRNQGSLTSEVNVDQKECKVVCKPNRNSKNSFLMLIEKDFCINYAPLQSFSYLQIVFPSFLCTYILVADITVVYIIFFLPLDCGNERTDKEKNIQNGSPNKELFCNDQQFVLFSCYNMTYFHRLTSGFSTYLGNLREKMFG